MEPVQPDDDVVRIKLFNQDKEVVGECVFDRIDEDKVSGWKWWMANGYTMGRKTIDGISHTILMHRLIMDAKEGDIVDHINGEKSNNRRENLQFVTAQQNAQNKDKKPGCASKYYGVKHVEGLRKRPWIAMSAHVHLGFFATEEDAAYAYDCNAKRVYGTNARTNKIAKPIGYVPYAPRAPNNVIINGERAIGLTLLTRNKRIVYNLQMQFQGVRHKKQFTNLEEAKVEYLRLKTLRDNIVPEVVPEIKVEDIKRNADGVAVLVCGKTEALVDDDVYLQYFSAPRGINGQGYPRIMKDGKYQLLHRVVIEALENQTVDHIDQNRVNAQRENLRIVTDSLNAHHRTKKLNATSKYSGVRKQYNKFKVSMVKDGILYYGGSYLCEDLAGFAANQLGILLYGEDANHNDVDVQGYTFVNNRAVPIVDEEPLPKKQKIN
jgi:hypothetical protein